MQTPGVIDLTHPCKKRISIYTIPFTSKVKYECSTIISISLIYEKGIIEMKQHCLGLCLLTAGLAFSLSSAMAETSVSVEIKDIEKLPNRGTAALFNAQKKCAK
ncbi:hypothetical protein [Dickeya dianthicola]|uniref:hypothetical protein n=1 Tax=Dickeya dianthicola TaxID=204039 RepID=UPI00301978D4